jgi:hypothetical protein
VRTDGSVVTFNIIAPTAGVNLLTAAPPGSAAVALQALSPGAGGGFALIVGSAGGAVTLFLAGPGGAGGDGFLAAQTILVDGLFNPSALQILERDGFLEVYATTLGQGFAFVLEFGLEFMINPPDFFGTEGPGFLGGQVSFESLPGAPFSLLSVALFNLFPEGGDNSGSLGGEIAAADLFAAFLPVLAVEAEDGDDNEDGGGNEGEDDEVEEEDVEEEEPQVPEWQRFLGDVEGAWEKLGWDEEIMALPAALGDGLGDVILGAIDLFGPGDAADLLVGLFTGPNVGRVSRVPVVAVTNLPPSEGPLLEAVEEATRDVEPMADWQRAAAVSPVVTAAVALAATAMTRRRKRMEGPAREARRNWFE